MATETPAPPAAAAADLPPRLADGVELLGEFADSGFREPPHLARRGDGQVIQLTPLLHHVAETADGQRDDAAMAVLVSERFGRTVSADNVRFLVEEKLRPLGVLAAADGSSPEMRKADPLLALRHRIALVPEGAVQVLARAFGVLHRTPLLAALLAALVAFDAWLLVAHGIGGGLRTALYDPLLLLGLLGVVIAATAFHEIGHATACRYAGARPGVLGAGVYLVWPAFYCDVTDAYRLDRRGRLRTDLGGVYFNALVALAAAGVYLATGFEPLVLVVVMQHLVILQQLMPLLRFDGYYVLSDATGVPDILARVRPILRSLVPGREADPLVTELKPHVRAIVTLYVAAMVPALLGLLVVLVLSAPRLFATTYDSLGLQLDRLGEAGDPATAVLAVVQAIALLLPCVAIVLAGGRLGRRGAGGLVGWARGSVPRALVAGTAVVAAVGLAAWVWWPNGDYEPLRPGERGTIGELAGGVTEIPSGRPSFSPEREARYGTVPTEREARATAPERDSGLALSEPRSRGADDAGAGADPSATTTTERPASTTEQPATTSEEPTAPSPPAATPEPSAPVDEAAPAQEPQTPPQPAAEAPPAAEPAEEPTPVQTTPAQEPPPVTTTPTVP